MKHYTFSKAKLEEFRQFLSLITPSIAKLSETHWKNPIPIAILLRVAYTY
jgi:hypothetical protein